MIKRSAVDQRYANLTDLIGTDAPVGTNEGPCPLPYTIKLISGVIFVTPPIRCARTRSAKSASVVQRQHQLTAIKTDHAAFALALSP